MRRLLASLLASACLMCAGCEGAEGATRETKSDTSVSQSEKTVTGCADYDTRNSAVDSGGIGECELTLHDGRHVTCAVMSDYRKGGLSCDWEHATKTAEKTE